MWAVWLIAPGEAAGGSGPGDADPAHPLPPGRPAATARLHVVEWGPGRVRIRYEAHRNEIEAALAAAYARPDGAADAGGARAPAGDIVRDLVKGGLVGLPLEGPAHLVVLEAREVARLPAEHAGHLISEGRLEGPAFLGEIGHVRNQRVVHVGFGPSLEGDRWIALYDRIEIEIRFADPPASGGTRSRRSPDRFGEALYAATILNCQQAQRWRQRRERTAARPAQEGSFPEEMVKVIVRHTGLHRISGHDLIEAGVELGQVHPRRIRMLYGGGRILGRSRRVSDGIRPEEIPIVVEDGSDGSFDLSDYLLFYGEATERWEYDRGSQSHFFRHNPYTTDNVYWLHLGGDRDGLRATSRSGYPTHADPLRVDQYRERVHQEHERFTLLQLVGINSGYDWYWESFHGHARNFSAVIRDAVDDSVGIRVRLSGDTGAVHWLRFKWNDADIGSRAFRGPGFAELEMTAPTGTVEGANQLGLIHRGSEPVQLDWIQLEYSRRLVARGDELSFDWVDAARAMDGGPHHGIAEFRISGLEGERPRVFDVSNGLSEITELVHDPVSQTLAFQDQYDGAGKPPAYRVAASSGWRRPARITRDTPSWLRSSANGADYVIITHGDFRRASERLAAWRAQDDRFGQPLTTAVVDVEDVYDEFSGGLLDPMAIRSFVSFAVHSWDPAPFFILLVGDGTYDYKNNTGTSPELRTCRSS